MAIPEAARLVLLAALYGNKSEVFLLDMGDPIKILDLAKKMIILSGKKIKNKTNQKDSIEIKIVGKRKVKKLMRNYS